MSAAREEGCSFWLQAALSQFTRIPSALPGPQRNRTSRRAQLRRVWFWSLLMGRNEGVHLYGCRRCLSHFRSMVVSFEC